MLRPALPLVLLLILAGCSGFTGQSTPTEQVTTAAPVPTGGAGVPGDRLAPGLASDGVTDVERLGRAHDRALANRSFTQTTRSVSRFDNGTVYRRLLVTTAVDADGDYLFVSEWTRLSGRSDDVVRLVGWGNDSHNVRRLIRDGAPNETEVLGRESVAADGRNGPMLADLLARAGVTVAGENTTDGRTEYLLTARGLNRETIPYASSLRQSGGRLRAVVTGEGFIRSAAGRATGTLAGEPAQVRFTASYDDLDETTVEKPAWVDRALANGTVSRPETVTATPADPTATPVDDRQVTPTEEVGTAQDA